MRIARRGIRPRSAALVLVCSLLQAPAGANSTPWSGTLGVEARLFASSPRDPRQHDHNLSVFLEPEFYREWSGGRDSFTFVPFLRLDQHDDERSHGDIRELTWLRAAREWELRVGVRKVFWVINQTDLVENIDQEDKLGQPMVNLALIRNWGTVDLFLLPGFRERTFPGPEGRLRTPIPVDTDRPVYESSRGNDRVDAAIRWSQVLGDWDVGVSHFSGTSREPRLLPALGAQGTPVLIPRYDVIDQTGLDVQATKGNWLWKLEALRRSGQGDSYTAAVGGFEYTFYGIGGTARDLGVLLEYHADDRGVDAATPFQNDLFVGGRLTLNDTQSTELLAGAIVDLDGDGQFYNLEASRRLGERFVASIELRAFVDVPPSAPSFGLARDDYAQMEIAYHF